MSTNLFATHQSRFGHCARWPKTAAFSFALMVAVTPWAAAADYESPPTLTATELAPANLLAGPVHKVGDSVTTDGFLTRFTVQSIFGNFTAVGPGMLEVRVHEIEAIGRLQDLEQDEEFQKGAKAAAPKGGKK